MFLLLILLSLVFQKASTSNNKSSKSVSGVTIDMSSFYFKFTSSETYSYGYIYYNNWDTCQSERNSYKLVCLIKRSLLDPSDYKSHSSDTGEIVYCDGSGANNRKVNKNNYFGCGLFKKSNNMYITSNQVEMKVKSRYKLDISKLVTYKHSTYGYIIGNITYKNWNRCLREYKTLYLVCTVKTSEIAYSDFTVSKLTKFGVNCDGNTIKVNYSVYSNSFYYGCALVNSYNAIFDYTTEEHYKKSKSSIDISSLKIINQSTFKTVNGTVYYHNFPLCSSDLIKLVCIMTVNYPSNSDFLNSTDDMLDVDCSGTYVNMRMNNINSNILSCVVIDDNRTFIYMFESYDPSFNPVIALKDVERENKHKISESHIIGTVKYYNWINCTSHSSKYYIKCNASYNELTISDIEDGEEKDIDCSGNKIDLRTTGKGRKVYIGCGIFSKSGTTIAYNIKKTEIKIDLMFLLKMVLFIVVVHVGAIIVLLVLMCIFFDELLKAYICG